MDFPLKFASYVVENITPETLTPVGKFFFTSLLALNLGSTSAGDLTAARPRSL